MAQIYGERWKVKESLGEGGQAHTFLVTDENGGDEILYVLKRLKNINRIERFKREIEVVRNLSHANILQLIDFNLSADKPYFVTEFCSGGNLTQTKPFWYNSPVRALELFQQICEGVVYAHHQGIVHRDLKPENIFLRSAEGPAVVGDFGICYVEEDGIRLTLTEEAVGPRLFIAPELEDGRFSEISSKSDIYSLGKILYWLLSGGKVFSREKHRLAEWDLKGKNFDSPLGWNNIYMEHVNRLLDLMIVDDPEKRREAKNILILARRVTKLVEKEFNPIAKDIPQPCKYCGQGIYELRANDSMSVRNFGFQSVGNPDWRIYVCNMCGNIQAFRLDMVDRKDWWS